MIIIELLKSGEHVAAVLDAMEKIMSTDPIVTRSLRFKYDCEEVPDVYQEIFRDMASQKQQKSITDNFNH